MGTVRHGRLPRLVAAAVVALAWVSAPPAWAGTGDGNRLSGDPSRPGNLADTIRDLTAEALDLSLATESLDGTVGIDSTGPRTTVTLTTDVLFPFGKADLTPAARTRIAEAAGLLRAGHAAGVVVIAGHTDHVGTAAYNQSLSSRRAQAVLAALEPAVDGLGVTLSAHGYGFTRPLVTEKTPTGADDPAARARNRRVEIIFSGLPPLP